MQRTALVVAYLNAIVLANLSIAEWGPKAAVYNGFRDAKLPAALNALRQEALCGI